RRQAPALAEGLENRDRGREEGRLGVLGAVELCLGAFEGEPADGLAERGVGDVEDGRGGRGRGDEPNPHADRLRTLARKDERGRTRRGTDGHRSDSTAGRA